MTRLTEDEKIKFELLKNESNLSQSEYIRKCVLHKSFRIKKVYRNEIDTGDFKQVISDLGKTGSNINQIAKKLNEGLEFNNINEIIYSELKELNNLKEKLIRCVEKNYGNY